MCRSWSDRGDVDEEEHVLGSKVAHDVAHVLALDAEIAEGGEHPDDREAVPPEEDCGADDLELWRRGESREPVRVRSAGTRVLAAS